jgi:V/A-type H+-transporting ATPase subunit K
MELVMLTLGWIGIFAPVALGAIGSIVGCTRAGQAAAGALLDTDSGYGKFIGVSAMPSSQTVYGIVMMLTLNRDLTPTTAAPVFAIGSLAGLALMLSAFGQGSACAAAISASKHKPEIFGISIAPAAVVEGFAVFALVFALVLAGSIPK